MKLKEIFKKPYILWLVGIFIFYILLNIFLSGFYNTIPLIIFYAKTVDWIKLGISLLLTLLIGVLVALNSVLFYIRFKERKRCKEGGILAGAGTAGGLVAGVCPLCVTGLLPLALGIFGISFSFASLPFQGIEVQVAAVAVLAISLWKLSK